MSVRMTSEKLYQDSNHEQSKSYHVGSMGTDTIFNDKGNSV